MKKLLLVRHGESEWNRIGKIQGQTDIPLTARGVEQARRIGCFLADKFSAELRMYVSPMQRARSTAVEIADALDYPVDDILVDERLNDFMLGDISGTAGWDIVARDMPELAWNRLNDPLRFHPPGGESGAEFQQRLASFLSSSDDERYYHLVVSHGVANKFLRAIRLGVHGGDIIALGESQDSVFELNGDREYEHRMQGED